MLGLAVGATTVVLDIADADGQFDGRVRIIRIVTVDVHIHHACTSIGSTVADAAQHALEDVDVMLSAIQATHAV